MKGTFINKFFIVFILLGVSFLTAKAQENRFISIQAENKQPFSAGINHKVYRSSATGYLIVPKLVSGQYDLTIVFTKKTAGSIKFSCLVDKDAGYVLKNFGDKGWGLFNIQTMQVVMNGQKEKAAALPDTTMVAKATETPAATDASVTVTKAAPAAPASNPFGDMLSDVVSDTTLTKITEPAPSLTKNKPAKPADTAKPTNENVATKEPAPQTGIDKDKDADFKNDVPVVNTKGVIKSLEETGAKGTDLVFIDFNTASSDTIKIFIPSSDNPSADSSSATAPVEAAKTSDSNNPKSTASTSTAQTANTDSSSRAVIVADKPAEPKVPENAEPDTAAHTVKNNVPLADTSIAVSTSSPAKEPNNPFYKPDSVASVQNSAYQANERPLVISQPAATAPAAVKPLSCGKMLAEADIDKLKKKMIAQSNESEMIAYAKKVFKGKCVATDQVKNIGGLFLSDEGRYNFYDAAYGFVYDLNNYPTLENQLLDVYYKKRFKTLIRN